MDTKFCTNPKCKKPEKPITEFYKNKIIKSGLSSWCKDCHKRILEEHHKKYPWKRTLRDIKTRCNNINNGAYHNYGGRGIECRITEEELKSLWYRDKAYLLDRPSIDRKENNGHYTFDNCRYIELKYNISPMLFGQTNRKPVLQYDLNGNYIREWDSIISITKSLNCSRGHLYKCLNGHIKSAKSFIWKYK